MIENDVGGGFGARGEFYPEDFLIPFAARHVGRPVKWIEDRRENLMAMNHAREAECELEIACDRDGTILGAARPRPRRHGRLYAHQRRGRRAQRRAVHVGAVPRSEHPASTRRSWMTNKTPVGTYRGPGRFEADFFRERLIDMVAARSRHRPRRVPPPQSHPGTRRCRIRCRPCTPIEAKDEIDSGDYRETLDRCLEEFGWAEKSKLAGQADRRRVSRPRGRLLHRRRCGRPEGNGAARDRAPTARCRSSWARRRSARASRRCSRRSPPMRSSCRSSASRACYHGSTAYVSDGYGAYHSRSIVMGGSAVLDAVEQSARRDPRRGGGSGWGCAQADVAIADGQASPARRAERRPSPTSPASRPRASSCNKKHTYSYGAHAAHVDGRCAHRRGRDRRLSRRGQDCRPHHQSADGARPGDRLPGAGARRRHAGESRLRRGGAVPHRLARRLPAADRERLSQSARRRHSTSYPSPINPLGAKGAGEGGIIAAGGMHGERGRQRAAPRSASSRASCR